WYGAKATTSRSVIHGNFWMAISFPDDRARADIENTSVSRGFAWAYTRKVQCFCFAMPPVSPTARHSATRPRILIAVDSQSIREFIKGLTGILQPRKVSGLFRAS